MPLSVLIVEDDAVQADLLRGAIEELAGKPKVVTAEDGAAALRILREPGMQFDLVLTDLLMPAVDGVALLRAMKEDPRLRAIPVIVLTQSTRHAGVLAAYDLQATNVFQKPESLGELRELVQMIVAFVSRGQPRGGGAVA